LAIFRIAVIKKPQRSPLRLRFFIATLQKIFCVQGGVILKRCAGKGSGNYV